MDKMDIFGYSFIKGYSPTRSTYLVMELKKDEAIEDDIDQLLKYVDWVNQEYAHGDYSMIHAFFVAYNIADRVKAYAKEKGKRLYTVGTRPARSTEWNMLKLVQYEYNKATKSLSFTLM